MSSETLKDLACYLSQKRAQPFLRRKGRELFHILWGGKDLCVKVYPHWESEKALLAYQHSQYLISQNIPTPLSYGLLELSDGRSGFVSQWLPHATSWVRHFVKLETEKKHQFLCQLFHFLANLHLQGCGHRDLSHWNVLVSQGHLYLVDTEDLLPQPNLWWRLKNVSQLLAPLREFTLPCEARLACQTYWEKVGLPFSFFWLSWSWAGIRYRRILSQYRQETGKRHSFLL